jgi:hypothetical protein
VLEWRPFAGMLLVCQFEGRFMGLISREER